MSVTCTNFSYSQGRYPFESLVSKTLSILQLYLVISSNICDGKLSSPQGYEALWLALITLIWVTPPQSSNRDMDQHIAEIYSVAVTLRDIVVAKCYLLICPDHVLDGSYKEEYDYNKLRLGWRLKVFGLSHMYAL